jgi:hypothetical protein
MTGATYLCHQHCNVVNLATHVPSVALPHTPHPKAVPPSGQSDQPDPYAMAMPNVYYTKCLSQLPAAWTASDRSSSTLCLQYVLVL